MALMCEQPATDPYNNNQAFSRIPIITLCAKLCPILPENCQYRGEGNSSLVVALKKEGKVLRLKKNVCPPQQASDGDAIETYRRCRHQAEFILNVMRDLLGYQFVQAPEPIPLSMDEIRIINRVVKDKRPLHRCKKNVEETFTYGLLLQDYCTLPSSSRKFAEGPVVAVEIKPKQGFLPPAYWLPVEHQVKSKICRFHLIQNYKKAKGMLTSTSTYCPLDLFSGCPHRMHQALKHLLYHPQNNIRIFKDKDLIFSEECKSNLRTALEDFFGPCEIFSTEDLVCELVARSLCSPLPTNDKVNLEDPLDESDTQYCTRSTACVCLNKTKINHHLPKGCVLERILRIQRLCSMDISSVHLLYTKYRDFHRRFDSTSCLQDEYPSALLPRGVGKPAQQSWENDQMYTCRKIWEFLVALTAKDCSIMLAFQRVSPLAKAVPNCVIKSSNGQNYIVCFAVVDLDPKHISKLEKVYQDDCNIVNVA